MTNPQTPTEPGLESPNEPGLWVRRETGPCLVWQPSGRKLQAAFVDQHNGGTVLFAGMIEHENFPKGGWLAATPAPAAPEAAAKVAAEEIADLWGHEGPSREEEVRNVAEVLRRHFSPPAPEGELLRVGTVSPAEEPRGAVMVNGIAAECFWYRLNHKDCWRIAAVGGQSSSELRLSKDGEWKHVNDIADNECWPTREAAVAFLAAHAVQHVSPAALADESYRDGTPLPHGRDDATGQPAAREDERFATEILEPIKAFTHGSNRIQTGGSAAYDAVHAKLAGEIAKLREQLAAAEKQIAFAGGYHERTAREIAIDDWLAFNPNHIPGPTKSDIRYLLDLVDAGRNRVHEEIGKREAAEQRLSAILGNDGARQTVKEKGAEA